METCKGGMPLNQNSSPQAQNLALSTQEQQALTAFFYLLYEIDQQNNKEEGALESCNTEKIEKSIV